MWNVELFSRHVFADIAKVIELRKMLEASKRDVAAHKVPDTTVGLTGGGRDQQEGRENKEGWGRGGERGQG